MINKIIPRSRCALARHLGSRAHNAAAVFPYREWLLRSVEALGDFPVIFHCVNVGPDLGGHEMVTNVYLPPKE